MKTISATLYDAKGVGQGDRDEAETKFIDAFVAEAGGPDKAAALVAAAKAAWAREENAGEDYMDAYMAGESAAFAGWHNPGPAHFEFD